MKKIICLFLLLALVACAPSAMDDGMQAENGRAVFTVTDAAADMGAVSEVRVTIESVQVHSTTQGWVMLETEQETFDLLELKASGQQALLADVEIPEDTYNQVRLDISSVTVVDDEGEHEAKLPSNELKLMGEMQVKANETATATFDFIADESLHVTGNGEYVLAPVVQVETRSNADVSVDANNRVAIVSGIIATNNRQGMDAEGNVGVGVKIPANANVSIGLDNMVKVGNSASVTGKVNSIVDIN